MPRSDGVGTAVYHDITAAANGHEVKTRGRTGITEVCVGKVVSGKVPEGVIIQNCQVEFPGLILTPQASSSTVTDSDLESVSTGILYRYNDRVRSGCQFKPGTQITCCGNEPESIMGFAVHGERNIGFVFHSGDRSHEFMRGILTGLLH